MFSLDHHDGSAYFARKRDGTETIFNNTNIDDFELRQTQLRQREQEIGGLIDDLEKPEFL